MRRYGDNVSPDEEEAPLETKFEASKVFFGGCGYGAGPFQKREMPPSKPRRTFWSLFKPRRKDPAEEVE